MYLLFKQTKYIHSRTRYRSTLAYFYGTYIRFYPEDFNIIEYIIPSRPLKNSLNFY